MAQQEFTGKNMTFVYKAIALTGLLKVAIDQDNGSTPEDLDTTTAANNEYASMADPLGAKGGKKATVTVVVQDSTQSVDDATHATLPFDEDNTATFCTEPATANTNQWDHTALRLTKRVTEITWTPPFATCTLTFEANSLGAWSAPA
jgi:hypothetical protein